MYLKHALFIEDQTEQLKSRGLLITKEDNAYHHLSHISYYRLAGYWWPMQEEPKENHLFKTSSKFSDVISLYNFDHELRVLIFDVIEKIEISLRTKLIYHLSHEFDPWWFQNLEIYQNVPEAIRTLFVFQEEIERSKDTFIKEHKKKHKDDLRYPPAWKTLELTSFGALSKIYGNLKNNVKSKDIIAKEFGVVNHTFLPSWLQSIAQIRNYCAHHSRLWNRNLPGRPKLLPNPPNEWITNVPKENEYHMLYINLCCMKYLLNIIKPDNQFSEKLVLLMDKYPSVDPKALGLKGNWDKEPLWNQITSK
ncbi:MAG: Abi family protein [Oligoflexus sp.]|nr:Abi family protein [Pseudopedobacter sp.]